MKVIVVGSARSGFAYICKVFQRLGLDVRHETYRGRHGMAAWFIPDVKDNQKFRNLIDGDENVIYLHQVRHPLLAISSMAPRMQRKPNRNYLDRPISFAEGGMLGPAVDRSLIENTARFWIYYNVEAEKFPVALRYRIEELPLRQICDLLGIAYKPIDVPTNTNSGYRMGSKPYDRILDWADLANETSIATCGAVGYLAQKYGYDV